MRPAPKRAASGARGAPMSWPTRFKPTRSSIATVSGGSLSASIGSGFSISAASPTATSFRIVKRAAAEAAPGVSAIAALAAKPWASSRASRSATIAASPPKRWAQPVISSISPLSPSIATKGV